MAIGKVTKYTIEELEEDEAYRARPQWMKFYYAAWLLSTARFDEEQQGWYIKLLTWAASEGDFPGYIIEDEDEIKEIAGFKDLPPDLYYALSRGVQIPVEVLESIRNNRLSKWQKVRNKFSPSIVHPGYISNRKLVQCLRDAYMQQRNAVKAGKVRAENRFGKQSGSEVRKGGRKKEIPPPAKQEMVKKPTALSFDDEEELHIVSPVAESSPNQGVVNVLNKEDPSARSAYAKRPWEKGPKIGLEIEKNEPAETYVNKGDPSGRSAIKIPGSRADLGFSNRDLGINSSLVESKEDRPNLVLVSKSISGDQENGIVAENGDNSGRSPVKGRRRRAPEIIFREEDFEVTLEMSLYIKQKWPFLDTGDVNYMAEKFKLVFHNIAKSSWKRTFYNFVDNQLVKYNYKPGEYKKLLALLEQQKGNQHGSDTRQTRPWESSAERSARLEREADERLRQLQGRSADSDPEDSSGSALTLD